MMMDIVDWKKEFFTVEQAAEKWGISKRKV